MVVFVWCFCSSLLQIFEQDWHISEKGMLFHLIIKNHDQQHTPAHPRSQGNKKSLLVCCSYYHIAAKQLWLLPMFPSLSSNRHCWKPHHTCSPKVRTRSLQCTGWAPGNTEKTSQVDIVDKAITELFNFLNGMWYFMICFFVVGFFV